MTYGTSNIYHKPNISNATQNSRTLMLDRNTEQFGKGQAPTFYQNRQPHPLHIEWGFQEFSGLEIPMNESFEMLKIKILHQGVQFWQLARVRKTTSVLSAKDTFRQNSVPWAGWRRLILTQEICFSFDKYNVFSNVMSGFVHTFRTTVTVRKRLQ